MARAFSVGRRLAEFTAALRELRQRAGNPTFRTMSRRCEASPTTLYRVEAGKHVPTLEAVLEYVRACDGDQALWRQQHRNLRLQPRGGAKPVFVPWRNYFDLRVPPPTAATLRMEMRRLRIASGLTLHEIAERTTSPDIAPLVGMWGLGVSTISDLCNPKRTHVPRRRTLHGFLLAIDADQATIENWLTARNRLAAQQDQLKRPAELPVVPDLPRQPTLMTELLTELSPNAGEFMLTRFRRLRNDLAHASVSSPPRIERVLIDLGLTLKAARLVAGAPGLAAMFVMGVDHEMHRIMNEGNLSGSAAYMALELAVYRTADEIEPILRTQVLRPRSQGSYVHTTSPPRSSTRP